MTDPQQFRKKPVTIEAMRFGPSPVDGHELTTWMERCGYPGLIGNALEPVTLRYPGDSAEEARPTDKGWYIDPADGALMIRTLEGDMRASAGDWIIRGVQGEFYPCKPDIFEATYEPVVTMIDDRRLTDAGERLVPAYPVDTPAQAQRAREEGQTYSLDGPLCEHDVSDPGQSECRCRLMRGHGGIHQCKHTLGKREEVSRG